MSQYVEIMVFVLKVYDPCHNSSLELLLATSGCQLNLRDHNECTSLHLAAQLGKSSQVSFVFLLSMAPLICMYSRLNLDTNIYVFSKKSCQNCYSIFETGLK